MRPEADRDHRDLCIWHLSLPALAAQLSSRLGQETQAVQPTFRELAAAGVQRQRSAGADGLATVDPVSELADAAEPHRLHHDIAMWVKPS